MKPTVYERKQNAWEQVGKEKAKLEATIVAQAKRITELKKALDNAQVTIHLLNHRNGKAYVGCPDCKSVRELVTK